MHALFLTLLLTLFLALPASAFEPPPVPTSTRLSVQISDPVPEAGRAQVERALRESSVRTFVVISDEVVQPGDKPAPWSSFTERAIEDTFSAWRQSPGFDVAHDVILFVGLDEREVRIRAGSLWDAEYGIHTDELTRITDSAFVPRARAGDTYGAIAATVQAIDRTFSELRDMPESTPSPVGASVSVWPPRPILPKIRQGLRNTPFHSQRAQIFVAQKLPPGTELDALADSLLSDDHDALAIVWDVRTDQLGIAGNEGWPPAHLDRLLHEGRPDGELSPETLFPRLDREIRRARAELTLERLAGSPTARLDGKLHTWPSDLNLPKTQALLLDTWVPVKVVAMSQADTYPTSTAPSGEPWAEVVAERFGSNSAGPTLVVIQHPPSLYLESRPLQTPEGDRIRGGSYPLRNAEPHGTLDETIAAHLATMLQQINAQHHRYLQEAEEQRRNERVAQIAVGVILAGLVLIGLFTLLFVVSSDRKTRYRVFRDDLESAVEGARFRYGSLRLGTEFERQVGLIKDRGEATSALYRDVTSKLDEIELGLRVLERRLKRNLSPLESLLGILLPPIWTRATKRLHADLQIRSSPTDKVLFAPIEHAREISPESFMQELQDSYLLVTSGWDRLIEAANHTNRPLSAELEEADLDALRGKLCESGIPVAWIERHPFVGQPEELARLDELRRSDPVAYVEGLEALRVRANDITSALEDLLRERRALETSKAAAERVLQRESPDLVLRRCDDPQEALRTAQSMEREALEALMANEEPYRVEEQLVSAANAYREVVRRRSQIDTAMATAESALKQAEARLQTVREGYGSLTLRLLQLEGLHVSAQALHEQLRTIEPELADAAFEVERAQTALEERRRVDVLHLVRALSKTLEKCEQTTATVTEASDALDRDYAQAQASLQELDRRRQDALTRPLLPIPLPQTVLSRGDAERARIEERLRSGEPMDWSAVEAESSKVVRMWEQAVISWERQRLREMRPTPRASSRSSSRRTSSSRSSWSSPSSSSSTSSWSSRSSSSRSSSRSSRSSFSSSGRSGGSSFSSSGRSGGSSFRSSGRSGGSRW